MNNNQRALKILAVLLAVGVLAASSSLTFVLGYARGIASQQAQWRSGDWSKLNQALYQIEQNYIADVDRQQLLEGALYGLVESLGDPYSSYLSPEEILELQIQSGGSYTGIGVEVTLVNNRVTILAPFAGSPAAEAGLLPGDQIVEVDGVNIEGLSLDEAVKHIRGEAGTEVTLGIIREGRPNIFRVTLVRAKITRSSVEFQMLPGSIGYIKLTRFSDDSPEEFAQAIRDLRRQNMAGLVLDLRGNPGGYLDAAINIARQVVPQGLIVYTENREGKRTSEFHSNLKDREFPMVVVVDGLSASASEILAGALQDSGVPVIGEQTFGKGTVQRFYYLDDGSAVKLTMSRFFTPAGRQIQGNGVLPDYQVAISDEIRLPKLRFTGTLELGSEALHVLQLQQILIALGYLQETATGIYDQNTADAVAAFQRDNGLAGTGRVDLTTTERLNTRWDNFVRQGDHQLSKALEVLQGLIDQGE